MPLSNLNIPVDALKFEPVPEYNAAYLHGSLAIGGVHFHAQAILVTISEDGILSAVHEDFADTLEAICSLTGEPPQTITIYGMQYVLVIYPHAT